MASRAALLPLVLVLAACSSLSTVPPDFPSPSPTGYTKAVLQSRPSLYWLMDTQNTLTDASGHNRPGVISGGTRLDPGAIAHSDNPALYLYPSAGVTSKAGVGLGPNTTLELWVLLPQGGSIHLARSDSSDPSAFRSVDVFTDADSKVNVADNAGTAEQHSLISPTPLIASSWHYLVLTDDGGALTLWLDGNQAVSGKASSTALSPGAFYLAGGGGGAPVALDEVALYPTALSPDVIASHWHLGCGC